ncbi:MAG: hypothetical protein DMD43_10435, partial [Gemmatimonadetes bacterium]
MGVPLLSMYCAKTSIPVLSPVPVSTTACPGFAEAFVASAGVPLSATVLRLLTLRLKGADVPPVVVTLIAPNAPADSGSVRFTVSLSTAEPNTFGPAFTLG